jgi:hypothetical protein
VLFLPFILAGSHFQSAVQVLDSNTYVVPTFNHVLKGTVRMVHMRNCDKYE